jgi:hypothetical protein
MVLTVGKDWDGVERLLAAVGGGLASAGGCVVCFAPAVKVFVLVTAAFGRGGGAGGVAERLARPMTAWLLPGR